MHKVKLVLIQCFQPDHYRDIYEEKFDQKDIWTQARRPRTGTLEELGYDFPFDACEYEVTAK